MIEKKKIKPTGVISEKLIQKIEDRLNQRKPIRRTLPLGGRLHIDRMLPFLVVYRNPHKTLDVGTVRLVKGEASYLIASSSPKMKQSLTHLIRTIVNSLNVEYRAFLIIEIWATPDDAYKSAYENNQGPRFQILTSETRPPTKTIEALEKSLKSIRVLKKPSSVQIQYGKQRAPKKLSPLFSATEARSLNCFTVGLQIDPIYRSIETGDLYPLVLRVLHRGVARAIKRAAFEFSCNQTTHRPVNYQSLGRRAVVKAVWDIDRNLAEISQAFDFLMHVTPINTEQAWNRFKRSNFEKMPMLYYRPMPIDPAVLKRKLFQIKVERVEDPSLGYLFREKQFELDRQITMLMDRGTDAFMFGSLQLFGSIDESLMQTTQQILEQVGPRNLDESNQKTLDAEAFAKMAQSEIEYYRDIYPGLTSQVFIREDTVGLMVSQGNLYIGKEFRVAPVRAEALLQHEIGTHVLTYFNGHAQKFQQLYCGLAGYEALQEGLAVLSEYLAGGLNRPRLRLLAGRVLAADCMVKGASFIETFRELNHNSGFSQRVSFTTTVRTYRGGGLTKDAVYLRGLIELLQYLSEGGDLTPLYVGKIGTIHIPLINELRFRRVLDEPLLEPRYMKFPNTKEKLEKLKRGLTPLNLIERSH